MEIDNHVTNKYPYYVISIRMTVDIRTSLNYIRTFSFVTTFLTFFLRLFIWTHSDLKSYRRKPEIFNISTGEEAYSDEKLHPGEQRTLWSLD